MVDHTEEDAAPAPPGQVPDAVPEDGPDIVRNAAPAERWSPLATSTEATGAGLGEGERVAKALARAGVASRREVERYIEAGRVALNGQVLTTPAVKVAPGDILTVDGAVVGGPEPTRLFRYHKPAGLITTNSDPQGRATVFEHLPAWLPRVLAVGRLDLNTEGLLLLTNDGALSRALELPSSGWIRRYRARAYGRIDQAALDRLAEGVTVDGVVYGPIEARLDKATGHDRESGAANVWISIGITEGKNREVRRVLEHLGLKVNRLIRLAYGPFALSTLPLGAVEEVGPRVIREQLAEYVAAENLPAGDRPAGPPPAAVAARSPPEPRSEAPRRRGPAASPSRGRPLDARPPMRVERAPGRDSGRDFGRGSGSGSSRKPAAEGAERRLAEAPRKAPPRPRTPDRSRDDRSRDDQGQDDRGREGRGREDRGGDPKRAWSERPPRERPRDDATSSRSPRRGGGADRPALGSARPDKPFGKPSPKRTGGAPPSRFSAAPGKPTGQPRKGGKASPAAGPARTGLELTPPMRRTPRGPGAKSGPKSGPRRPPRKD